MIFILILTLFSIASSTIDEKSNKLIRLKGSPQTYMGDVIIKKQSDVKYFMENHELTLSQLVLLTPPDSLINTYKLLILRRSYVEKKYAPLTRWFSDTNKVDYQTYDIIGSKTISSLALDFYVSKGNSESEQLKIIKSLLLDSHSLILDISIHSKLFSIILSNSSLKKRKQQLLQFLVGLSKSKVLMVLKNRRVTPIPSNSDINKYLNSYWEPDPLVENIISAYKNNQHNEKSKYSEILNYTNH